MGVLGRGWVFFIGGNIVVCFALPTLGCFGGGGFFVWGFVWFFFGFLVGFEYCLFVNLEFGYHYEHFVSRSL